MLWGEERETYEEIGSRLGGSSLDELCRHSPEHCQPVGRIPPKLPAMGQARPSCVEGLGGGKPEVEALHARHGPTIAVSVGNVV